MKKFSFYIITFAVSFVLLQIVSGLFLTIFYTPDLSSAWHQELNTSNKIIFGNTLSISAFIIATISAVIAYFLTSLFQNSNNTKKGAH